MTAIKLGSKGAEVRNIQRRLNCQVTGIFSSPTYRAVVAFQEANSVLATGEVDEQTYELLFPKPIPKKKIIEEAPVIIEKKPNIEK